MAKTQPTKASVSEEQVANNAPAINEVANTVGYAGTIKKLIASGAKRVNSVRVKNVNFTEKDNYTMVSLTIDTPIEGFISEDEGDTYKKGKTNTVFTSLFAIAGALKEDEDLGWMANSLLEKPEALNLILNGAKVDILQSEVSAGEEYRNPFSTRDDVEAQVYDHDVIINNLISFKLGATGLRMSERLADKLLGF